MLLLSGKLLRVEEVKGRRGVFKVYYVFNEDVYKVYDFRKDSLISSGERDIEVSLSVRPVLFRGSIVFHAKGLVDGNQNRAPRVVGVKL